MLPDDTRRKITNITTGAIIEGVQDTCTTIRNLLCASFPTSTTVKKDFESKAIIKEEQVTFLETYINSTSLWATGLPSEDRYLTRGGEARVYLNKNVIKEVDLNDGVYYATQNGNKNKWSGGQSMLLNIIFYLLETSHKRVRLLAA